MFHRRAAAAAAFWNMESAQRIRDIQLVACTPLVLLSSHLFSKTASLISTLELGGGDKPEDVVCNNLPHGEQVVWCRINLCKRSSHADMHNPSDYIHTYVHTYVRMFLVQV